MKKTGMPTVLGVICLVLIMATIATGCQSASTAPPASAPAPADGAKTSAAPAAAPSKVYNLKFWLQPAESAWQAQVHKRFMENVKQKTGGRVVFTPYWSESLAPSKESINALKSGLADFGQYQTFTNPGEFPVSDLAAVPFLMKSPEAVVAVYRQLYKDGLMPEYAGKGFKTLDFQAPGMQYLMFKDKQVASLEQMKGLKIRSQNAVTAEMLTLLGATPVSLASGDVYMSLDRGVIDGTLSSPGFMAPNKFYEVAHVLLDQPLYSGNMFIAINQRTWESLPADLQTIFAQCVLEYTDDWLKESHNQEVVISQGVLKDKGVSFYKLSDAELARWKQATAPMKDKFIKSMNDLGLQGQRIVDTANAVQAQMK